LPHGLVEEGIVRSNDLSKDYILIIMRTNFPERKYSSFAPLFRKKIRNWNWNGALNGARRESMEVPSPSGIQPGRDPEDSDIEPEDDQDDVSTPIPPVDENQAEEKEPEEEEQDNESPEAPKKKTMLHQSLIA
jgi:hypothetical protein